MEFLTGSSNKCKKIYVYLLFFFYGGTPGIAHNTKHGTLCVYKHHSKMQVHTIIIVKKIDRAFITIFTV